ncbi:hypothetical protein J3Q64DRAFT_1085704 [Phycomyces blakesleeanus]|uniref:AMP-dependent synthetase/ligase domain-containing protein n=2 Tax=Phycomyces blakesleeanus TaxID=4837 RepID=A0A162Q455_PHYB8|nr:hypothetical protein PHYBLDRAFT_35373 [Phycomyces blakesleeanus NRRL 1555(-)]OAD79886.1 hypothetical protein PHYBLDRAFT_35373 [Phycomyces blakesleeanus NRRL 1555(-)]|eukprot:XP_018297926.1 hypothetical protein PHYBLDRAFT_35373 [Phycomyces blakesleeanus NRRL 1555(-)]
MYHSHEADREYPIGTIFDTLFEIETSVPGDRKIYIDYEHPETYLTRETLKRDILLFAQGLKDEYSFKQGDIMAICSPNHVDWAVALQAPPILGAVSACVVAGEGNHNVVEDMLLAKPKLIIAHEETLEAVKRAAKKLGLKDEDILVFGNKTIDGIKPFRTTLMNHSSLAIPIKPSLEYLTTEPAYIYYTSGTSGTKKMVTITHTNIVAAMYSRDYWLKPDARYLSYASNAHSTAMVIAMNVCIKEGTETYLMKNFSLKEYCVAIQKYKIQFTIIQPWVAAALAREPFVEDYDLSSILVAFSAGSPLDTVTISRFMKRHKFPLLSGFGMTEIISGLKLCNEAAKRGSVGRLCPNFTAKIINENGEEIMNGTMGELCLRGPVVTPGYYNNPKATEAAIDKDGFFHCGDFFRVDEDGFFYFISRIKDIIKYYGYQISPSIIEDILITHPDVSECCVVGHYSEELFTELPKAFVVLRSAQANKPTEEELISYTNNQLPNQMHIRGGLVFLDSLPRSSLGKVQRNSLRHQIGQETLTMIQSQ